MIFMSNDNRILIDEQPYNISWSHGEQVMQWTLTCARFIGAGEVVDVFEMRDNKGKLYALKIPQDPSRSKLVEDEYKTLRMLEEQHKLKNPAIPVDKATTPTGNYFVQVHLPNNQSVVGLLMRFLDFPYLADFYRGSQNKYQDNLKRRLHNESIAWYAASQYLKLIQTQLDMKTISVDRKRDTFLWDNADKDPRLIVMDWNVMDSVDSQSEGNALYNFAQTWFTMFTQLQAKAIPTFWDDDRWDNLSLKGRNILMQILRRDMGMQSVSGVKRLIDDYYKQLIDADSDTYAHQLLPEFQSYLGAWENRSSPLTRKAIEEKYMGLVYLADILRRLPIPEQSQAQAIYDEAHHAIEVRGELSDRQLSAQRNLDKVKAYRLSNLNINDKAFLELREALLTLMLQDDSLKTKLFAIESGFQTIPNDFYKRRIQAREMRERLDEVATLIQTYGVKDGNLSQFYGECDAIDLAYQADDDLLTGNLTNALDKYQRLLAMNGKYPLEHYTHLTPSSVEGIIALLRAMESPTEDKNDPHYYAQHAQADFLEYADISDEGNDSMLRGRIKRWHIVSLSSQLSTYDKLLLQDYIGFAELLVTAHSQNFVRGTASHYLAYELGRLRRRFPVGAVKRSISQSTFYKSLQKMLDDPYIELDQITTDSAQDKHLHHIIREEAYYLYQLVLIIKG